MTEEKTHRHAQPREIAEVFHRSIQQAAQLTPAQIAEKIAAGYWLMDANFQPGAQGFVLVLGPAPGYAQLVERLLRSAAPGSALQGQLLEVVQRWMYALASQMMEKEPDAFASLGALVDQASGTAKQTLQALLLATAKPPGGSRPQ